MAELGAVASVLQVAQFGAQLSLTLYNVAQTVKTASQDVKRIAKEIALFAQVLKDLGSALDRGQGSKLYRGDAYETSRMIVEECEGVFKEIEEILFKRTTKESRAFDAALSIPKAERFLWVFRKGRVQLLRSNLESLKSTISLKLAVLTYADKHTSSIKRSDDADDVLSLKSLVLANETATGELRELTTSTRKGLEGFGLEHIWSPGRIATHGVWNLSPTGKPMGSPFKGDVLTPSTTPESAASLNSPKLNMIPRSRHYNGDPKSPLLTYPELSTTATDENAAGSQGSSEHQRRFWGNQDKLELAVKKLDVAIWELGRIENNIKLGRPVEHQGQQYSLLVHLEHSLVLFGMSSEQVHWAMNRLANCNTFVGERTETIQEISKSDVDLRGLRDQGIPFLFDKDNYDRLIINRWLPDIFEDILWSHMKQRTHHMEFVLGPEQLAQHLSCSEVNQQHELNHSSSRYQCSVYSCHESFLHPDILTGHMERQSGSFSAPPRSLNDASQLTHSRPFSTAAAHEGPYYPSQYPGEHPGQLPPPGYHPHETQQLNGTISHSMAIADPHDPLVLPPPGPSVKDTSSPIIAEPTHLGGGLSYGGPYVGEYNPQRETHVQVTQACDACRNHKVKCDSLRHNNLESRGYRHEHSLNQVSMAESDTVPTIMTTTVPPLSPNTMLEPATQPFSVMSIYSTVDYNTPSGFVNQPMSTLNDLSQLPVLTEPHGSAPDLVYGATTLDNSQFYSSDSCYSPNSEYPHAWIAGQSYLPRHDRQHSPSFTSYMGPCYQPPLYSTSTLPAWLEAGVNPNDGLRTNPSSEFAKPVPGTASNTSATATSDRAITSPSVERKRKNTQIGDSENAVPPYDLMAHGPPIQPSRPTWSRQISSTERSPPQKLRRTMKKSAVSDNAESNVNAEAKEATEEALWVDPDQAVKNLLRKWTTLLDMPLEPSYGK